MRSFTTWNAYASRQETKLGALVPGRRADLVVCSDVVFTCPEEAIPHIVPLVTMLSGEVVFSRDMQPQSPSRVELRRST